MIKKDLRAKIIEEVKNGASYKATAKKFGVSVTTVSNICKSAGIHSKFTKVRLKKTDEEIVEEIRKHKVISIRELNKKLEYADLTRRLFRMARDGKVYIFFIKDKRYVFVDKNDFKEWGEERIKHMPRRLRKTIIEKFKHLGIKLKDKKVPTVIPIDKDLHEKIKAKAKEEGTTIREYIDRLLRSVL